MNKALLLLLSLGALILPVFSAWSKPPKPDPNTPPRVGEMDQSTLDRIRGSQAETIAPADLKVATKDRSVVNRVQFEQFRGALLACGYSPKEVDRLADAYCAQAERWDAELDYLRLMGMPPLRLQPELAAFETIRARVGAQVAPDPAEAGRAFVREAKPKDHLLACDLAALSALRRGDYPAAKQWLDETLAVLNRLSAKDPSARKARGVFTEEARKNFRGEIHERVMAYYYRGLLYWMDGEVDNARACFRNAQLQDSDTEKQEYANDYVLLDFLDGLASAKLGQDGQPAFQRAAASAKMFPLPTVPPQANVLFFVEFGNGPVKVATGKYAHELRIRPGRTTVASARLTVGGQDLALPPADDLLFQASTRGGRVMDHILANKVVFKDTTSTVGDVSFAMAMAAAADDDTVLAAPIFLLIGLISKAASAAANPDADVRTWWNLPRYLSVAGVNLPAGEHEVGVRFLDLGGNEVPALQKTVRIQVKPPAQGDTVVLISDKAY